MNPCSQWREDAPRLSMRSGQKNEEIYFSGSISAIKADPLGQEFCFFFTDSLFMM
jgi:hypothetical protein